MTKASIAALSILIAATLFSQNPSSTSQSEAWRAVPEITVQTEDYAAVRSRFHSRLLKTGPAPEQVCDDSKTPEGASRIIFSSGKLRLKAWIGRPKEKSQQRFPVVLFLHGGFCFDISDWQVTQIFRDAGFVVMIPVLRGEDGQPGNFTMFYDEVDDVMSAAEYLRHQSDIDDTRLYLAGHSTGGTLTILTSMADAHFAAAASFSGSPDAVGYTRHALVSGGFIPFDYTDPMELQVRSARVYAASFKCPVRIYYGSDEAHFALSSQPTAKLARDHGLDVQAIAVDGGHNSALEAEIRLAIVFFQNQPSR
jgi:dienelactone hydrolase